MRSTHFDTLTRSLASSASRRDALKMLGGSIAAGVATYWGVGRAAPLNAAPMAMAPQQDNKTCQPLMEDTRCPSNYQKEPIPGHKPSFNGCGGEGSGFRPPQSFGRANFVPSCNAHDVCYENCGMSQGDCDSAFLADLVSSCAAAYPGIILSVDRFACYDVAGVYTAVVASVGGEFYREGQKKACRCCRQKTYCKCNETCYDSTALCLTNCKATLGCFTGICAPAEEGQCS